MMQIFIDALKDSKNSDCSVQYVLHKGLNYERVPASKEEKLLDRLKNGWDIAAKFNNGVEEESYIIRDTTDVKWLLSKIPCAPMTCGYAVTISFQHFYDGIKRESTWCQVVSFFTDEDGISRTEKAYIAGDALTELIDAVDVLRRHGLRQYKSGLIRILEVNLGKDITPLDIP